MRLNVGLGPPKRLQVFDFNSDKDPLVVLGNSSQPVYLRHYLADLDAQTVLVEPQYFDKDFLSEHAAFYGTVTRNYPNICRRFHFFSRKISRATIQSLMSVSEIYPRSKLLASLQENYLGYCVERPIPHAQLGRTVLRWYNETTPNFPRRTDPSRNYTVNIGGLPFMVYGVPWQQQDGAVATCATVALWSLLHSSGLGDHPGIILTTSEVTKLANKTMAHGARVFPSDGLHDGQMLEAIKETGLAPVSINGDSLHKIEGESTFKAQTFANHCASLIRAGFPCLISGYLLDDGVWNGHVVCAVGFRETEPEVPIEGVVNYLDSELKFMYVHDDNLGPNVRFEIFKVPEEGTDQLHVELKPSAPTPRHSLELPPDPTLNYGPFVPTRIITGTHPGLRLSPGRLIEAAKETAQEILIDYNKNVDDGKVPGPKIGLTVSTRFMHLSFYLGNELSRMLSKEPKLLSRTRLQLLEKIPPMSLHVGVARISFIGTPIMDVIFDTTDCERNLRAYCNIRFSIFMDDLINEKSDFGDINIGPTVVVY